VLRFFFGSPLTQRHKRRIFRARRIAHEMHDKLPRIAGGNTSIERACSRFKIARFRF
jgi:hypothetical protein